MLFLLAPLSNASPLQTSYTPIFDGANAFSYLVQQCDFGPRPPGSDNLSLCRNFMVDTLESFGWTVILQNFTFDNIECSNVIARYGTEDNQSIILGAHYDTRPNCTEDSANRHLPVLGANDGASGTAALLEIARVLPNETRPIVELVFFDAEDSGGLDVGNTGTVWSYIIGSNFYVDQMSTQRIESTRSMILLDMIGDENLRLQRELSSTDSLQNEIWDIADQLSHGGIFLDTLGGGIIDDHKPFLDVGIPALDIIHHNPFPSTWHTINDIPDRCSAASLEAVGEVVEAFLVSQVHTTTTFDPDPPILLYLTIAAIPIVVFAALLLRYKRS